MKLKTAASRIESGKQKNAKRETGAAAAWNIISWPLRALFALCGKIWRQICRIDLIGLVNTTLLSAIIVLFSMLIIDIVKCRRQPIVFVASDKVPEIAADKTAAAEIKMPTPAQPVKITTREIKPEKRISLPLKKEMKSGCRFDTLKTVKAKECKSRGDVIIDGMLTGGKLPCGTTIQGNLYLQNMRRFTLPCNLRINGSLFLRNVEMLKFCGDFIITGNIYVSRNSSFGPIPRTSRLGGHVIF
jgi:hypothetical protein